MHLLYKLVVFCQRVNETNVSEKVFEKVFSLVSYCYNRMYSRDVLACLLFIN